MEPVRHRPSSAPALVAVPDSPRAHPARRAFGHSADRAHLVDDEAAAVREAARRVLAGKTLSSVVKDWNERGRRPPWSGPARSNL